VQEGSISPDCAACRRRLARAPFVLEGPGERMRRNVALVTALRESRLRTPAMRHIWLVSATCRHEIYAVRSLAS
jgi:hypothetical protein